MTARLARTRRPSHASYLDHAATTPMLPEAAAAMTAQLGRVGNASSLHASGRDARRVVEESRETIARRAGLPAGRGRVHLRRHRVRQPRGQGPVLGAARRGPAPHAHPEHRRRAPRRPRPAALAGRREGAEVELLPVDRLGRLDVEAFRAAVERDPASVALVTVMWANNEVGTVQPVAEVVEIAHAHGIPVHTDAVQAVGQLPVDFAGVGRRRDDASPATRSAARTASARSSYAASSQLTALLHGGGQERDIRSGTIDAAGDRRASRPRSSSRSSARPSSPTRLAGAARRAGRRRRREVSRTRSTTATRSPARPPAAGQRPPDLPRLRGRLAADAARRPRHRVLDRVGLLRRRAPALARAAGDGLRRRGARGPRCGSPSATPPPRRTSTRWSRRSVRSSSAPAAAGSIGLGGRGLTAGPGSDVGRRRLGGRRRARGRGRATTSPASTSRCRATRSPTAPAPAAAARSRTPTTRGARPT